MSASHASGKTENCLDNRQLVEEHKPEERGRTRKSRVQVKLDNNVVDLLVAYKYLEPKWDSDIIQQLAERSGYSYTKIYKWGWDFDQKEKSKLG